MIDIINNRHEKVLIIGNGFDLNLGLNTKYEDFMQSSDFAQLVRPGSIFSYLLQQKERLINWIDIEIELKNYSTKFTDNNFESDFNKLCKSLINYISKIDYSLINKSSHAYRLIETLSGKDYIIFDFNYTDSISYICKELKFEPNDLEKRIIKVHGSAREGKIIFGVEDSATIKPRHIFLKKAYPPHYKAISLSYQLKNSSDIHIFGHSLGETDHTYFNDFFQNASNEGIPDGRKKIYLYYYGQSSYLDLHIQVDKLTRHRLTGLKHKHYFGPIDVK